MRTPWTGPSLAALMLGSLACSNQFIIEANPGPDPSSESSSSDSSSDTSGDGDGDGDTKGDGDGDTNGDGDTDGDGDGDGDTNGDGDGDTNTCIESVPVDPSSSCVNLGIDIAPEFAASYTCELLGLLPNIPSNLGGLSLSPDDPNRLLLAGAANTLNGQLYGVELTRSADCHITGWSGSAIEVVKEAPFADGGVTYGPSGVLFLARWPNNEIGQLLPGSDVANRVVDLSPLDVISSPGALNFVPDGFPGAGELKLISWGGGQWYTLQLTPHEDGTFEIPWASYTTTLPGGPEGFVYIHAGNPGFSNDSILVSEYSSNRLTAYEINDGGDPINDTRRDFMIGIGAPMGGYFDSLSGDFLFTADGGGKRLIVVRGFSPD